MKNNKGITLIALVITIIILIILAGVSINILLDNDGLIDKTKKATENMEIAQVEEQEMLNNLLDSMIGNETELPENTPTTPSGTVVKKPKDKTWDTTKIISYADGIGNTIPAPAGFIPITVEEGQGTKTTGFVIKDTRVDNQGQQSETYGNEFVWIPVQNSDEYTRIKWTDSLINSFSFSDCSEELPEDEKRSIEKYGGFYIGRYETGIIGYDEVVNTSNSQNEEEWTGYTNGRIVIQKDKQVWNYITFKKAKKEAEELYDDIMKSKLCSSYAWDTTLKFIMNQDQDKDYPINSIGGCYGTSNPSNTGYEANPKCNIYDMGGNVNEWTTEKSGEYFMYRGGGHYDTDPSTKPASSRWGGSNTEVYSSLGFRVTLYMK